MFRARLLLSFAVFAFAVAPLAFAETPTMQRLHDALHLTPAQQPAWSAFAAAAGPDPEAAAQARAAQTMMPTLRAPQRVDLTIATMRAQLEAMQRRGAALRAFYTTLSPDQQAIFDRETLPRDQNSPRF